MIREKSLVVYKNRPALVTGREGDKIIINGSDGEGRIKGLKVREKDVLLLHPGPCESLDFPGGTSADARGAWELLEGSSVPLRELSELVFGGFSPGEAWAAYSLLLDGLYFTGDIGAVKARSLAEVEAEEKRRSGKRQEAEEREALLDILRKGRRLIPPEPPDSAEEAVIRRMLQDAEALALGKTEKSRLLRELGWAETPQEAHRLLLSSGFWTVWNNPYPGRFGLSLSSARIAPSPPPAENRTDLTRLAAYAIDNAWSGDPDDAVSLEKTAPGGPFVLWVHVADPAASVRPGTPPDIEARGRGATLYLPEGGASMLAPEALPLFALGLSLVSPALSFKIVIKKDLTIEETEIVPSLVKVERLTYEEADGRIDAPDTWPDLAELYRLALANMERRLETGAVFIDMPEIHITVADEKIRVEPLKTYKSSDLVRECMVLAGEGTARWALQRRLPFPFAGQEAGDLPLQRLPSLAGSYQIRRCMRPRSLSVKPAVHWGLGLDEYTQVTSPLRRYTDLLAHQQIRAFLKGEDPLGEEELSARLAAAEAGASAAAKAERASRAHWIAVYLADMKARGEDRVWEGVVMEKKGPRGVVLIPALGLETQAALREDAQPNDRVSLRLGSVKIHEAQAFFTAET